MTEPTVDPGSYGEGEGQESDKTWAQKIEERVEAIEAHLGLDESQTTNAAAGTATVTTTSGGVS